MAARVDINELSQDELQFRTARFELLTTLNEMGHYGCIVFAKSYKGAGVFMRHLYPVDRSTLSYKERGEIRIDALYDKTKLYPVDIPHITDREVARICNDKIQTYKVAGSLQPESYTIRSRKELAALSSLDNGSGLLVLKSPGGHGGKDIYIDTVDNVQTKAQELPLPLVVQEFIETSQGVPGLCDGRHDVRVLVLDGTVLGGSIRTPREGEYLSNTHQGGTMRMLAVDELPSTLLTLTSEVDSRLPKKPRLYAADFMYSKPLDRWFLIELNGSPGALPRYLGPVGQRFQQELPKALLNLIF